MPLRTHIALVVASLALPGCDALCAYGFGDNCGPCDPVSVPEAWEDPKLESLVPGEEGVVCEADGDELGSASISFWVPTRVHETNVATVGAAQEAGWIRAEDNWYEDNDTSQMPKWSKLGMPRGDRMRIDVKSDGKGSRVDIRVDGVPPPPSLRGDVTVFAYRQATFALFDGRVALLPGVSAGVASPSPEGFLFRAAPDQYSRYQSDGTVMDLAPFPVGHHTGSLNAHGRGPQGFPWMTHNPNDNGPLLVGELAGDAWDIERVPDIKPPLPSGTVDAVHAADGTVWILGGDVLYAKDSDGWHATRLAARAGALRPMIAEGNAVLISTERAVLRVYLDQGKFNFSPAAKLEFYAELYDAGPLGVVARTSKEVVLIQGETITPTHLPGETSAPDLSTNAQGVIAVATKNPSTVMVRETNGAVTRFPAEGELDGRVLSLSIDPMGRVWTLMVDSDPFVIDNGTLLPLEGLVGPGMHPSSITFLGSGAPPFLDIAEEYAMAK